MTRILIGDCRIIVGSSVIIVDFLIRTQGALLIFIDVMFLDFRSERAVA
jgi:hypothetical protein